MSIITKIYEIPDRGVLDTTLHDQVCQWPTFNGQW